MAKAAIYKGDDFSFSIFLTQPKAAAQDRKSSFLLFLAESPPGEVQDTHVLAGTETVSVKFSGQAGIGSPVIKTIGAGVAFGTLANGELVISGDETSSALLLQGDNQTFDVIVTTAGAITTTYERLAVLDVKARQVS